MCGICFVLYNATTEHSHQYTLDHIICNSMLSNRGPDATASQTLKLSEQSSAICIGHVLHLRGDTMAEQPAKHSSGNLLLWNGEIFGGIPVPDCESDTHVLLELLSRCSSESQIMSVFSQIHGPWSFIYWQASSECLWFGRDVFGRRSLLWHLPEHDADVFVLSSVQIKPWSFKELPSVGIFKMTRECNESRTKNRITLFPWQSAVWPGTLNPILDDQQFTVNLCSDEVQSEISQFEISHDITVPSQMPALNKSLPPADHGLPELGSDQSYIDYLQCVLETSSYLQTLSRQLTSVLLEAVRTRVHNQCSREIPTDKTDRTSIHDESTSLDERPDECVTGSFASCDHVTGSSASCDHVTGSSASCDHVTGSAASCDHDTGSGVSRNSHMTSSARVAILFSGGIDSTVIAALADKCIPSDEPIDLLNVAFEMKPKNTGRKGRQADLPAGKKWDVPDRLTGYTALSELNSLRRWNFIEVNVTAEELQEARLAHIQDLLYPLQTVLDDSIGCAVWFASRGSGMLGNGPHRGSNIKSTARVILCGMGADEQLIGYSRHRVRYKEEGWIGLINEIELEVTRISARNLGRDDRIITDHGKESRFPFLDERVVQFLSALPVYQKADLTLPRGLGEKLLLRLSAAELCLPETATLAKRAIQFGSRIAKLENRKEKATDICCRLTKKYVSDTGDS